MQSNTYEILPALPPLKADSKRKPGPKLVLNDYLYTISRKSKGHVLWKCTFTGCKGTATSTLEYTAPVLVHEHSQHPPNKAKVDLEKARHNMKTTAVNCDTRPARIYAEHLEKADDTVKILMPDEDTVRRNIRHYRSAKFPSAPKSLADLVILPEFKMTEDGRRFFLFDIGPDSEPHKRIIIFSTDEQLLLLANAERILTDGNFGVSPDGMAQLFTLRVPHGNTTATVAISDGLEEHLLLDMQATQLLVDYEKGIHNAFTKVLYDRYLLDIEIAGCFFHLADAVLRNVKSRGHAIEYSSENAILRKFVCKMEATAFLPPNDVKSGIQYLWDNLPVESSDAASDMLTYFDSTYVNGPCHQVRRQANQNGPLTLRTRQSPPNFPPATWNVYQRTLDGIDRTNNPSEGWNNGYASLVGGKHPNIWRSISTCRLDEAKVHSKVLQDNVGRVPQPLQRKRKVYTEFNARLKTLCERYSNGYYDNIAPIEPHIGTFLDRIAHNLQQSRF